MNILILHKYLITGGIERTLLSYLPIFDELGYTVDLLLTYNVDYQANHLQASLPETISTKYIFSSKQSQRLLHLHQHKKKSIWHKLTYEFSCEIIRSTTAKTIKQQINRKSYDLILDFSGMLDKNTDKSVFNIPIIRWLQSENDLQHLRRRPQRFQDYAKIVAITQNMYNTLFTERLLPADKYHMMYQPLNLNEIREKSKQAVNLAHQDYLLVVSRLVNGKGLFELIDIYHELKQQGIQNKLYILGEGELEHELRKKISTLALENDCFLLGAKSNPYPYFKAAKLFTFTSESEGFGMVILESMACGVPVVVMDCPVGPREIVGQHNEYGKLVPLHHKAQFIQATLELLNNPTIYADYQAKSIARSLDFAQEKTKTHIHSLFHSLLNT